MFYILKKIGLLFLVMLFTFTMNAQTKLAKTPGNNKCLQCHGNSYYKYNNEGLSKEIHKRMNPYFIINKDLYKTGVHRTFECTDCHLPEYEAYPHDAKLKLEAQYTCQDCHSGDENFAKFHFDEIEIEVKKSIHGRTMEDFKCESCHNPHYYQLSARKKTDIKDIVKTSNQMCLQCHNYTEDRYYLLSDSIASINENSHAWLPNQALHFKNVRCIECHTRQNDTLLVAHNILGKEKAVKRCVECHSDNSILMTSLYRHENKERRNKLGFFNGLMMNDAFVIGANRNYYLNAISIGAFSFVLLLLLIHIFFRIIFKK